mmetsp:Transcript_91886/g.246523  ORF Transcript_91886/g.246523 Transcript_91886/m.246523 type:complete len:249 (+) Transcript_91886:1311-2057(+)
MSVSMARVRIRRRPSLSKGPPNICEPPSGSDRSSGSGLVPIAKHGAASTAASSLGDSSSSWVMPIAASDAAPRSGGSSAAGGLSGLAVMKTLNSRQRLMWSKSSPIRGFGCAMCTWYLPAGSSISNALRMPRCSPIHRPSGTWRAMRTRSSGMDEPASMYRMDGLFTSMGILARTPSRRRNLSDRRTTVGPMDQPLLWKATCSARAGTSSTQGRRESESAKSSRSRDSVARPTVTRNGAGALGRSLTS